MTTSIMTNIETERKVETLHNRIVTAKAIIESTWAFLSKNLIELKDEMGKGQIGRENWRNYVGVDSFKEYCDHKVGISSKTCYQMINVYKGLLKERPELEQELEQGFLDYTKFRVLFTKKALAFSKENPKKYLQLLEMALEESISRREVERQFDYEIKQLKGKSSPKTKKIDPDVEKFKAFCNREKENVVKSIKEGDVNGLLRFARDTVELVSKKSTRVESDGIIRIVIANSSKDNNYTRQVIDRAKQQSSKIEVVYSGTRKNGKDYLSTPRQLYGAENYWYMKDTLVIRERKSSFIETFGSPGDIVENLNTAFKPGQHCSSTCHYCYQQASSATRQEIYYNWDVAREEFKYEPLIHTATLTLWSVISHIMKKRFTRIPYELNKAVNKFRPKMIDAGLSDDQAMVQYLSENLGAILKKCSTNFDQKEVESHKQLLPDYYNRSKNIPLWLWVSEYSDILAIEPIAGQLEYIIKEILPQNPEVNIAAATKSAHGNFLLKYDGQDRVKINMNLNPEFVVNKYETQTSSLSDRIKFINKLQNKSECKIRLSFEPMLIFEGWEEAYKNLVDQVASEVDLGSLDDIVLGSIRLRNKLEWKIQRNYPWSDLLVDKSILDKAKGTDGRSRYKEKIRIEQYSLMIQELAKHTDAEIILGAEHPDIWDKVNLDWRKFMDENVHQYDPLESD